MKDSLKINPRFGAGWKQIGHIFYENNNVQNSSKYYQRALECDSKDVEARIGLANSYYLLEHYDQAIENYEELTQIDKNDEIEYNLGNCYYMKG